MITVEAALFIAVVFPLILLIFAYWMIGFDIEKTDGKGSVLERYSKNQYDFFFHKVK